MTRHLNNAELAKAIDQAREHWRNTPRSNPIDKKLQEHYLDLLAEQRRRAGVVDSEPN